MFGKIELDSNHLLILKCYINDLFHHRYEDCFNDIYFRADGFISKLVDECAEKYLKDKYDRDK